MSSNETHSSPSDAPRDASTSSKSSKSRWTKFAARWGVRAPHALPRASDSRASLEKAYTVGRDDREKSADEFCSSV
jgi:hypothetical protein